MGMLTGFPNQNCATCCVVWSVWGFISFITLYLLMSYNYRHIDNFQLTDDQRAAMGKQSLYAGFMYLACAIGCLARCLFLKFFSKPKHLEL